jgi:thiamine monophosphate kinase
MELGLCGGEDFELLVAVRERDVAAVQRVAQAVGSHLIAIGRVVGKSGLVLRGAPAGLALRGFEHFRF